MFENQDVRELVVLFGGAMKGNKVDKTTGIRTAEEYFRVNIIEVDDELRYVKNQEFYVDETLYDDVIDLNLELLKPCRIMLKCSATSMRPKLVGVNPFKKEVNNNSNK